MKMYIVKECNRQKYVYKIAADGTVEVEIVSSRECPYYVAKLKNKEGYTSYEVACGGTLPRDPEKREAAMEIFEKLKTSGVDICFFSYAGADCWFAPYDAWDALKAAFKPERPVTPLVGVQRWAEVSRNYLPWDPEKAFESQTQE